MKKYLLGVDIGTTGAKAVLVEASGRVIAEAISEYPMCSPEPLWAEQNPEDWWKGTCKGVGAVIDKTGICVKDIVSIGLTGQMHGLVIMDKEGEVIRPCIMWNDQRSAPQCTSITGKVGASRIIQLTGNSLLPGFSAPKLQWVREYEPEIIKKTAKLLLPKDYVRYRLTGEYITDVSDASGTSFLDVKNRRWSKEMLSIFRVSSSWLPKVTESQVASAVVSQKAASETGLSAGTTVIGGASDQASGAVGTSTIKNGDACAVIGTSGVVFAASDRYIFEPRGKLHAFCHAIPGTWHVMGVTLSAGGSFRWLRDSLWCHEQNSQGRYIGTRGKKNKGIYNIMTQAASAVDAGSGGLLFLPYLSGERTPHPDPRARGAFIGLTLAHSRAEMTRAVMEGVTFSLRDCLELVREMGIKPRSVRVAGGGAESTLWLQMLSDVFALPVSTANITQGAAFGAAVLASVGGKIHKSVPEACARMIGKTATVKPGRDSSKYQRQYSIYKSIYPALKSSFNSISEIS